jgi:hypothetical protein
VSFAARYLSHDESKALDRSEADDLAAHGIWVAVVFEDAAERPLAGYAAGVADAQVAAAQAAAAGMPDGRPIYFAADFDTTPDQQAAVNQYLAGAGSVLGTSRVGIYGGFWTVSRALDAGVATWGWQTVGWSGGQWDSRAQLRQPGDTVTIGGVDCDTDTAQTDDFGQWMPGRTPTTAPQPGPTEEDYMDSNAAEAWFGELNAMLWGVHNDIGPMKQQLAGLVATVTTLAGLLAQQHPGVDTAAVVSAVQDAIAKATVNVHVDVAAPPAKPAG